MPHARTAALVIVAALALAACSDDDESAVPKAPGKGPLAKAPVAVDKDIIAGSTMEKIRQRGTLIVGGSVDAPLLSQQNPATGDVEGFDADMGKLLAKYIIGEPKVKLVNAASETREALLANGTVDVVLQTYTITPERARQVAFAGPYYESGLVIATRRGQTGIAKPADLAGKKVIAGANTPAVPAIEKAAPSARVVTFGSDPECLQALKQGRGVAYVQDQAILLASVKRDKDLQIVSKPFTKDPYGIGLRHGDAAMKRFVNGFLERIQAGGQWQDAWKRSIGTVVPGAPPRPPAID